MTSKVFKDAKAALFDMRDGVSVMSGGFGLCGIPENSILEIRRLGIKNLHAISNNIGNSGRGLAWLLKEKQISQATKGRNEAGFGMSFVRNQLTLEFLKAAALGLGKHSQHENQADNGE